MQSDYLALVAQAGKEIAVDMRISDMNKEFAGAAFFSPMILKGAEGGS